MSKSLLLFVSILFFHLLYGRSENDSSVKRILFLGNSITYNGTYINDIEAYLLVHHPQQRIEIINAGLPSETVSGLSEPGHAGGQFERPDLHERLERVLAITHPDIVYACYGMNDGIYMPIDQTRFEKFKAGIHWLHDKVVSSGASIVHLTPPVYDELKGKKYGYSYTLDKYSDWLIEQKGKSGWDIVDVHYPMKKFLKAHRRVDKKFHLNGFALAEDGVHPNEVGHWIMAKAVLTTMNEKEVLSFPDLPTAIGKNRNASKIIQLVAQKQAILKDAYLSAAGHKRPGMNPGMPLSDATLKAGILDSQIRMLCDK